MVDFWETVRGKELADALIHALPILAGEAWKKQQQKQFVVCVNHNESIAYLSHHIRMEIIQPHCRMLSNALRQTAALCSRLSLAMDRVKISILFYILRLKRLCKGENYE